MGELGVSSFIPCKSKLLRDTLLVFTLVGDISYLNELDFGAFLGCLFLALTSSEFIFPAPRFKNFVSLLILPPESGLS